MATGFVGYVNNWVEVADTPADAATNVVRRMAEANALAEGGGGGPGTTTWDSSATWDSGILWS